MRRIHDFYRNPPRLGQTIVLCPVYDRGEDEQDWAWFAIEDGESAPADADPNHTQQYDGRHAREVLYYAVWGSALGRGAGVLSTHSTVEAAKAAVADFLRQCDNNSVGAWVEKPCPECGRSTGDGCHCN